MVILFIYLLLFFLKKKNTHCLFAWFHVLHLISRLLSSGQQWSAYCWRNLSYKERVGLASQHAVEGKTRLWWCHHLSSLGDHCSTLLCWVRETRGMTRNKCYLYSQLAKAVVTTTCSVRGNTMFLLCSSQKQVKGQVKTFCTFCSRAYWSHHKWSSVKGALCSPWVFILDYEQWVRIFWAQLQTKSSS